MKKQDMERFNCLILQIRQRLTELEHAIQLQFDLSQIEQYGGSRPDLNQPASQS